MPSDAKKAKAAAKKAGAKRGGKATKQDNDNELETETLDESQLSETANSSNADTGTATPATNGTSAATNGLHKSASHATRMQQLDCKLNALHMVEAINADNRSCTGVLASHPHCRDVHIHQFSMTFYGQDLIVDGKLELNHGRRYGLLGLNGSGKSQVLFAISNRDIPIPKHVDIFHLSREIAPTEMTALQAVCDCSKEIAELEAESEELLADPEDTEAQDRLQDIYEQLDELTADNTEARAAGILYGLGFTAAMQVS